MKNNSRHQFIPVTLFFCLTTVVAFLVLVSAAFAGRSMTTIWKSSSTLAKAALKVKP